MRDRAVNGFRMLPEIVFPSMALLFGSMFVFLVPPFQSPDEPAHFLRAYQVSEGIFFPETKDQRLGGELPVSLVQVCDSFSFLKMNYEARLDKSLIFRGLNIPLAPERRQFTDFPNTAIYAPTAYIPQAAAIALLRPLGASPLLLLYACRLANLFVWLLLVWAAIRLIPFLKNTLTALAMLPASLVIAASANADVLTNGLCWWLVAGFCAGNLTGIKKLTGLAVVCTNKLIALPLVLLYWWRFHPTPGPSPTGRGDVESSVENSREEVAAYATSPLPVGEGWGVGLRFTIFLSAALVAALAWGTLAQKWFIPYDAYNPAYREAQTLNEGVDPAQQQAFMLQNPLYFAKIAAWSAIKALPSTAAHVVGKFGWEKNYLSPVWLALLWLALTALVAAEENPFTLRQRWLAASVVALYVVMFAATMYALWCPVGAGEVTNFQGRYFVPVLPVVSLAIAGGWLRRWKREIWMGGLIIQTFSNLAMIWSIWERYYVL
ncbi:MAG TPA: DUF2142 domain-containing protein [Saprospiraceae bacterium]|nr:DUF2142 domain-containing protein [Saprospiraceae bacterium]